MKGKLLLLLLTFCLFNCKKKDEPAPIEQLPDQLSESQLQVLDAAPTDLTTGFSDVLFPDGSNISDWANLHDSGYLYTFSRGAADKKNLFIKRMTEAGLLLTNDNNCSCYPAQPNGLAYVFGSKRINTTYIHPSSVCQQPLYGLDCSGLIYQMAIASSLNLIESGTVNYVKPSVWNSAFNNSPDFQGLTMTDLSALSPSLLQAGDMIVQENAHIGMVYSTGTTLGIINSQGSYKYTCAENSQAGRGPVLKSNVPGWVAALFPNNQYHVLRVVLSGAPGITTKSITSINQTKATSGGIITNEGGSPVTSKGVCWSTSVNPTISNFKTSDGGGNGNFNSLLSLLQPNTTYYVRAYATNSYGTGYGNQVSFKTLALLSGEVASPGTGRVWLNKNLGASRVALSKTDHLAYGSLFQWGREADDHQLINWTNSTTGSPVYGTTTALSPTNFPGHSLFIYAQTVPYDWRTPQNSNLWQGPGGINNPCPNGYRVPTLQEFLDEKTFFSQQNDDGAFESFLKLPVAGIRVLNGILAFTGTKGYYWTSTLPEATYPQPYNAFAVVFYPNQPGWIGVGRYEAFCVRCIKN